MLRFDQPPANQYEGPDGSYRKTWKISLCENCHVPTLWREQALFGIMTKWLGPDPNPDMPMQIGALYEEARAVLSISPRASAALLRRLLERLLYDLGARTGSLDAALSWAKDSLGLPPKVFDAARTLKLMGDHSLHGGIVDLFEEPAAAVNHATAMMDLVNLIVAHTTGLEAQVGRMQKLASDAKAANRR